MSLLEIWTVKWKEVMELLTDLHAKGATILMVTHSDYDASFSQRFS
jgi:ABC-type lipoprotein export system ATPase subunit